MPRSSAARVQTQPGSHKRPAQGSPAHEEKAAAQQPAPSVHPVEPEDGSLTGTSRAQQQEALGQNVAGQPPAKGGAGEPGQQAQPHPETPAGQHATGSFTAKKSEGKGRR